MRGTGLSQCCKLYTAGIWIAAQLDVVSVTGIRIHIYIHTYIRIWDCYSHNWDMYACPQGYIPHTLTNWTNSLPWLFTGKHMYAHIWKTLFQNTVYKLGIDNALQTALFKIYGSTDSIINDKQHIHDGFKCNKLSHHVCIYMYIFSIYMDGFKCVISQLFLLSSQSCENKWFGLRVKHDKIGCVV